MKKTLSLVLYLALFIPSAIFISSCSSDDEGPTGQFTSGVFVVNEGAFLAGDGSITHFQPGSGAVNQAIFSGTNSGAVLGDVVQSMAIDNGFAYIVVNNSNKMEVVNANTFESEFTILDLALPRYFTVYNGKGYVTEWVSFVENGRVSVLDLENRTIESTIETDAGAEFILEVGGRLYVSNSFTTTVSVIDPGTNTVTNTIDLGSSVAQMVVDQNQNLWAISGGTTDFTVDPPVPNNDGALFRIDLMTNTSDLKIELNATVSSRLAINNAGDRLLFIRGNQIFSLPIDEGSGALASLVVQDEVIGFYGIDVEPGTDIIYAGDARGFQGNGVVYRYESDGRFIDSFDSGRGPNGFIFK